MPGNWVKTGLLMAAYNIYRTILSRKEKKLYVSLWYIMGTVIWMPMLYFVGNVMWQPVLLPGPQILIYLAGKSGKIQVLITRVSDVKFWAGVEQGGVGFPGGQRGVTAIRISY